MERVCVSSGFRYSLPQQELVDSLLFPHALHNQPVQVDKQSTPKTTGNPTHRQSHGLLGLLKVKHKSILGENKISHPIKILLLPKYIITVSVTFLRLFDGKPTSVHLFSFLYWNMFSRGYMESNKSILAHDDLDTVHTCSHQSIKVNFMPTSLTTNQPTDSSIRGQSGQMRAQIFWADQAANWSGISLMWSKPTYPRMANAGSSWRSNGKSRRKRVLKRAVMVSEEKKKCSFTCLLKCSCMTLNFGSDGMLNPK